MRSTPFTRICLLGLSSLLLLPAALPAQGGFRIGSSTNVVCTGSPSIVISNGLWRNDGYFVCGNSQVRMVGSAPTALTTIEGQPTNFYDLTLQKSANDVILQQEIGVLRNLTMNGGLLELNNFNVYLGTAQGQIVNESETNRITGITGGEIVKAMVLNAPVAVNPGNLGAQITSAANLGNVTIRRGHVQQNDTWLGFSIHRYYDILPTNNTGLSATLRQHYFDAELAGYDELQLSHFNSLNNVNWYNQSFTTRDINADWVEQMAYPDFQTRWTLGSSQLDVLPVRFVETGIACEEDQARLYWVAEESQHSAQFAVEMSEDQVHWETAPEGIQPSQGQGLHAYAYEMHVSAPWVRIRQTDLGGATQVSEALRFDCYITGRWSLWPNPARDALQIRAPFDTEITAVEILDARGALVKRLETPPANRLPLTGLDLRAGLYVAQVYSAGHTPVSLRFVIAE